MSISNLLKSIAVMSFGGVLGYTSIHYFQKTDTVNRHIASQPISKIGAEQNAAYLFEVKLDNNDFAATENDVSTIQVNVQALKDLPVGLTYTWNLPQDVELLEGHTSDVLGNFVAGESRSYVLKVKGFSKQLKKYVSFEIQGEHEQKNIRREVLISSRYEDSMEYLVQQNEIKSRRKMAGKLGTTKSKFSPENVVK